MSITAVFLFGIRVVRNLLFLLTVFLISDDPSPPSCKTTTRRRPCSLPTCSLNWPPTPEKRNQFLGHIVKSWKFISRYSRHWFEKRGGQLMVPDTPCCCSTRRNFGASSSNWRRPPPLRPLPPPPRRCLLLQECCFRLECSHRLDLKEVFQFILKLFGTRNYVENIIIEDSYYYVIIFFMN